MASSPLVRVEFEADDVAVLTLNDAAGRNALRYAMSEAIADAVGAATDAGAAAIILTAVEPVFCAGGNLDELEAPVAPLDQLYRGMFSLATAEVPTIALVDGPAVGAGVNLALACDVVLATPNAKFDPRWLDVGIHPGGGHLWRLGRRVGRQSTAALILLGEALDGHEAERVGLAWKCIPSPDARAYALGLANRVASRPAELVRAAKRSIDVEALMSDVNEAIAFELGVQAWSMEQPFFTERVAQIRERMTQATRRRADG